MEIGLPQQITTAVFALKFSIATTVLSELLRGLRQRGRHGSMVALPISFVLLQSPAGLLASGS
jgi:hypothetical protein